MEQTASKAEDLRTRIAMGDPVLAMLGRHRFPPLVLGLLVSLGVTLVRLAVAAIEGHLWTENPTGFFRDPAIPVNAAFACAVVAWYGWIPRGLATLIEGLLGNRVFKARIDQTVVDRLVHSLSSRRWSWAALAGTVIFMLVELPFYLQRMDNQDAWSMATPASVTLSLLWAGIGIYALLRVIAYYVTARRALRRLFNECDVRVRPLHPDRAGGLGPLGAFSIRMSYLMTLIAVFIPITAWTRSYLSTGTAQLHFGLDVVVGIPFLAVLSAYIFFSLPAVAHDSMKKAKDRLLLKINRRFEFEYRQLQKAMIATDTDLEPGLKQLDSLQQLHETTARFPVWPLDVGTVSRFASSWLAPIAVGLLTTWLEKFLS